MNVLMLSPVNPAKEDSGYKIAVVSDILALKACGVNLRVLSSSLEGDGVPDIEGITIETFAVKPGSRFFRAMRALLSTLPAAVERYYTKQMRQRIIELLGCTKYDRVIIQDAGLAGWIPLIRSISPQTKIVVRSHNFMACVTELQYKNSRWYKKLPCYIDHRRWRAIERYSVVAADIVWTISEQERLSIADYYGVSNCEYLPVSIDYERYSSLLIEQGGENSFAHLGTLDMKKSPGMTVFLNEVWANIVKLNPAAVFHLGGRVALAENNHFKNINL